MIEPNRLTNPGESRARDRVELLFQRLDELGNDLVLLPVPVIDPDRRADDLAALEEAAGSAGRAGLLDEARQRVRDSLLARVATRTPIGYGPSLISSGSVGDQVVREMAIEDVVAVAVVGDALDRATAARLSTPGYRMLGLLPPDGAAEVEASGLRAGIGSPLAPDGDVEGADLAEQEAIDGAPEAPDDVDEDAPDDEDAAGEVDEVQAEDALRLRRAVLFVAFAAIALPIAYANGLSLPMLVAIVGALAVIAWLFADG